MNTDVHGHAKTEALFKQLTKLQVWLFINFSLKNESRQDLQEVTRFLSCNFCNPVELNCDPPSYFFEDRFFVDPFFEPFCEPFFDPFFEPFLAGTFPPSRRASDSPIAIACFVLVTFLPEPPLFNVPCLRSCIAFSTFSLAFFPYLAIHNHLPLDHYNSNRS